MSTLKVDTLQTVAGINLYTIRSWIDFGGQNTVSIRRSGNVSSVTDLGIGSYQPNFSFTFATSSWAGSVDGRRFADVPGSEASPNTAISNRTTTNGRVGTYDNDTNLPQDSETVLFMCLY